MLGTIEYQRQVQAAQSLLTRYPTEAEHLSAIQSRQDNIEYADTAQELDPYSRLWTCKACGTPGLSYRHIAMRRSFTHCPARNFSDSKRSVRRLQPPPPNTGGFVFFPHTPFDSQTTLEVFPLAILKRHYDELITHSGCQIVHIYHSLRDLAIQPWVTDRMEDGAQEMIQDPRMRTGSSSIDSDGLNVIEAYFERVYPWTAHSKELDWVRQGAEMIELPDSPQTLLRQHHTQPHSNELFGHAENDDEEQFGDSPIPIVFTTTPWNYSTQNDLNPQIRVLFLPFAVVNTSHYVK